MKQEDQIEVEAELQALELKARMLRPGAPLPALQGDLLADRKTMRAHVNKLQAPQPQPTVTKPTANEAKAAKTLSVIPEARPLISHNEGGWTTPNAEENPVRRLRFSFAMGMVKKPALAEPKAELAAPVAKAKPLQSELTWEQWSKLSWTAKAAKIKAGVTPPQKPRFTGHSARAAAIKTK